MPGPLLRFMLMTVLIGAGNVAAQSVTPPVPSSGPPPGRTPVPPRLAPPTGAAHHRPAHPAGTPVVKPKPGPSHQPPPPHGKAVVKPVPAAPAPAAPVPPPVVAPEPDKAADPAKGSNTGNPLPRFATLRTDEVNLRTGPGTRYPIDWVYKRRDLPVVIEREFEVWRLIRDPEGVKGWVHQATLAPRRTGVVTGQEQVLRSEPKDAADPVARLKPGVIIRLRSCEATSDWCQVQVQDYRGWMRRTQFWGTLPGEAIQ